MILRIKLFEKFTFGNFQLISHLANNDKIPPHPKAKLLDHIWKLKMIPKLKLFAWKLIRRKIPTRRYLRTIEMDINGDFPFFVKTSGRH